MRTLATLVALATMAVGCNDQSLQAVNTHPSASITSHEDGFEVMEGAPVTFRGHASDADAAPQLLTATWYVGTEVACAGAPPDDDGVTLCEIVFDADDSEVILEVLDDQEASGSALVSVVVIPTDAPQVSIVAPDASGTYYSDQLIAFEGLVEDNEDEPTELVVSWTSSLDGDLDVADDPDSSGNVTGHTTLSEGEHAIELWAEDSTAKTGSDSVVITVGPPNSQPSCEILSPASGSAGEEGGVVVFEAQVSDVDVPADWLTVSWESDKDGSLGESTPYSDGEVQFTYEELTVATHNITMTVTDEVGATCVDGLLYTIGTPPEVELLSPSDGETHNEGDSITFEAQVSDDQDDGSELQLSWESDLDGVVSTQGADSSGSVAFALSELSSGDHILTLRVTDSGGLYATAMAYFTVNALPTAPTVGIAPDPAYSDDDLVASASGSSDPDGSGTVTYSYAWYESSVLSTASSSATFPASATTKGLVYKVVVTPSDGTGDGASAEAEITIDNTAPEIATPTISPSSGATAADTLVCTATATDLDGDTPAISYAWTNDSRGSSLGSGSSLALSSSVASVGEVIGCTATATDDEGATDSASTTVTLDNGLPSVASVSIAPDPAYVGDMLTCSYAGYSDPEGDTDASTIAWAVDGASAGSGTTLSSGFVGGDTVTCTVTPHDGTDAGTAVTASLEISNTAPQVDAPTLGPDPAYEGDTLTCTAGSSSDADGHTVYLTYDWDVSGSDPGVASTSLSSSYFGRGDAVTCSVTAHDGFDDGTPASSNTVTIGNTAPSVSSVSLSPSSVQTDDTITASASTSDVDGDTVTVSYAWYVDGSLVAETGASLDGGAYFDKGQTVYAVATPSDGTDDGTTLSSGSLTVGNSAPGAPTISIDPDEPSAGMDDLICLVDSDASDADGDSVSYDFDWDLNGTAWTGSVYTTYESGDTIDGTDTTLDDVWTCTATPDDGTDTGTSASASVTVITGDSDGDGVDDEDDQCEGYDDSLDTNGNRVPDDCEQTQTFSYTGAAQSFEVPDGVDTLYIECQGASGWSGSYSGGQGGHTTGDLAVTPGDYVYVYVGGQGGVASGAYAPMGGGWNGGGDGQSNSTGSYVGGGGGASDLRTVYASDPLDSASLGSRVIVAGGGGGATNNTGAYGGDGGGSTGEDGGQHGSNHYGTGGTQTTGGDSGGGFGYGGSGETWMTPWNGGGGGGWYGGGTSTAHSGGGGGSSYTGGVSNGTMTQGGYSGDGQVVITWAEEP